MNFPHRIVPYSIPCHVQRLNKPIKWIITDHVCSKNQKKKLLWLVELVRFLLALIDNGKIASKTTKARISIRVIAATGLYLFSWQQHMLCDTKNNF